MKKKLKLKLKLKLGLILALLTPSVVFAHENYVLSHDQINAGMSDYSAQVLDALKNPINLYLGLSVAIASTILFVLYFGFQHSKIGVRFDKFLKRYDSFGSLVLRIALGASFIASAKTFAYLGPEISVYSLPLGTLIHGALYVLGVALILGFLSEVVGAISLVIILAATWVYKDYMLTYFNYYGEFIALMIFGSRIISLDRFVLGLGKITEKRKNIEIAIIRITYGLSILYPAIIIKLIHPGIIVQIFNQYNLGQFHWLFPSDPLLVALGTGLAQVAVGICITLGFQTRLNTLITFILMVMSVIFFKEAVWPHYILLALAFYLMINNGGEYGVDHYIHRALKRRGMV
jgi:uncharacterized membrane protein YphA (DoxX/SURF4 family)